MSTKPYIIYPATAHPVEQGQLGAVSIMRFVDEPGQVSFGVIDYVPGWFIALHHHHTWELIIIDSSSEGPGYTFFGDRWWRADPGSGVFIPKGFPHAWSAGNDARFKMLWIYGDSQEEAGRVYDVDPGTFQPITREAERGALVWTPDAT